MLIGTIYGYCALYDFYFCRVQRYKVLFKENKATSASIIGENFDKHLEINIIDNKKIIKSFIVWGDNQDDAIEIASGIVDKIVTIL